MTSAGIPFPGGNLQNPVLLAAGTCGFGREVSEVVELEALGGLVTKSITLEPRVGNPAPRVAEFTGGMINSIGLANPGVEAVKREYLPWIQSNLRRARCFLSLAGHDVDEYIRLAARLDDEDGFQGFELNLSCPNDQSRDGAPFALDPVAVEAVVRGVRGVTSRPLLVKLAPNPPAPREVVAAAEAGGADALTLVNTLPGLLLDPYTGAPRLGAGRGGVSGPALRGLGLLRVQEAREWTTLPLVGVGGILNHHHARSYLLAGATAIQVGTLSFADPRGANRVVEGLRRPPLPSLSPGLKT